MTRKPSRRKPTRKPAKRGTGGADKPAPKNQPDPQEAASDESPAVKKVTLPAFGFAEDLLIASAAGEEDADGATGEEAGDGAAGDGGTEPSIDETDPRRILTFADSLEQRAAEPEAAPRRLETWVAFSLAGEVFALPVTPIREVVRVSTITRVPHAPKPIRGVTNRRGRVIPVIDLRLRIGLPAAELGRASRVIVVSARGRLLGLLVDAVHQVVHVDVDRVQPPPDDVMTVQSDYLSGVYHLDDQLILLLDVDRAMIIQEPAPGPTNGAPGAGAAEDLSAGVT